MNCKCYETCRYCECKQDAPAPVDTSSHVVLIVERGSVLSKPDYVDLIEIERGATHPIVVRSGY